MGSIVPLPSPKLNQDLDTRDAKIMYMRYTIYPLMNFQVDWDSSTLKIDDLPIQLAPNLTISKVSDMITAEDLGPLTRQLGEERKQELFDCQIGLLESYSSESRFSSDEADARSKERMYLALAFLRMIRPMREKEFCIQVCEVETGKYESISLEYQPLPLEVPEIQKLYNLRHQDLETFIKGFENFVAAMNGDAWKFRMAVQFYILGHVERGHWKNRYFLWMAGLDALLATRNANHREQLVVKTRVKSMLGEDFPLYTADDFPSYLPFSKPDVTLSKVLEDLFALRNDVIHGHRIETTVFSLPGRRTFESHMNYAEQLIETASIILRNALFKALESSLDPYTSEQASEEFWTSQGLTNSEIKSRYHKIRPN